MRFPVFDWLGGTTIKLTWVNSGVTPTSINACLLDKNETLVQSYNPVSSLNGHYYAPLYLPSSDAYYVGRWIAVVDAATYVNRCLIKTYKMEVS